MSPSPELHSKFMEFMLEHNRPRMDGFKGWVFHPGMRFQALEKWWGDQGRRAVPHEGLDLYSFEAAGGRVKTVDQQTQIPAAFAGQVVKIDRDFLGKSIYISHAIYTAGGRQLLSAVGHTVPQGWAEDRPPGGRAVRSSRRWRDFPAKNPTSRPTCT